MAHLNPLTIPRLLFVLFMSQSVLKVHVESTTTTTTTTKVRENIIR